LELTNNIWHVITNCAPGSVFCETNIIAEQRTQSNYKYLASHPSGFSAKCRSFAQVSTLRTVSPITEIATPLCPPSSNEKMPRFPNRNTRYARRRTYKRTPVRRKYGGVTKKRRTYRRKTSGRGLINKMSKKKRDIMVSAANATANADPIAPIVSGQGPTILANGIKDGISLFSFCPTWRYLKPSNASYVSQRTSSRLWLKGISETLSFIPNDGSTWIWRRYIVRWKGNYTGEITTNLLTGAESTSGATTTRKWRNYAVASTDTGINAAYDSMQENNYMGVKTTDWSNQMNAKLDNTKFDILYDKTTHLRSGNQAGAPRRIRRYHPLNCSIVYDDEENGLNITPSPSSVLSKLGKGNVFIFDLFTCPAPISATTSSLAMGSNCTLYWHEK